MARAPSNDNGGAARKRQRQEAKGESKEGRRRVPGTAAPPTLGQTFVLQNLYSLLGPANTASLRRVGRQARRALGTVENKCRVATQNGRECYAWEERGRRECRAYCDNFRARDRPRRRRELLAQWYRDDPELGVVIRFIAGNMPIQVLFQQLPHDQDHDQDFGGAAVGVFLAFPRTYLDDFSQAVITNPRASLSRVSYDDWYESYRPFFLRRIGDDHPREQAALRTHFPEGGALEDVFDTQGLYEPDEVGMTLPRSYVVHFSARDAPSESPESILDQLMEWAEANGGPIAVAPAPEELRDRVTEERAISHDQIQDLSANTTGNDGDA